MQARRAPRLSSSLMACTSGTYLPSSSASKDRKFSPMDPASSLVVYLRFWCTTSTSSGQLWLVHIIFVLTLVRQYGIGPSTSLGSKETSPKGYSSLRHAAISDALTAIYIVVVIVQKPRILLVRSPPYHFEICENTQGASQSNSICPMISGEFQTAFTTAFNLSEILSFSTSPSLPRRAKRSEGEAEDSATLMVMLEVVFFYSHDCRCILVCWVTEPLTVSKCPAQCIWNSPTVARVPIT